jgi:signal transduction histidine kinase
MNDRITIAEVLQTFFGLLIDTLAFCKRYGWDRIKRYAAFVWRVARICLYAVSGYGFICGICLFFHVACPPLYSGFFVLLGAAGCVIAILMYPFWLSWEILRNFFPQAEKSLIRLLRFVADIAFWSALFAIYCYIVPVWNNPGALPLFLLVALALVLAGITGRITYNPKLLQAVRTVQLVGLLVLVTVSFTFPQTARRLLSGKHRLDDYAVEMVTKSDRLNVSRFQDLVFFNTKSGRPQVWMCKSTDGDMSFYSGEGYDSQSRQAFELVESEKQVEEIRQWFSNKEKERAQAQRVKEQAEASRVAKQREEEARNLRAREEKERQEVQDSEERKRSELAKQEKDYISRYVRNASAGKTNFRIALLVATEDQQLDQPASKMLEKIFLDQSFLVSSDVFTPAFVSDGLFEKSFSGSKGVLDRLALTNLLDVVVLARQHVVYTTNDSLNGLITASLTIDLSALSTATEEKLSQFSVAAAGPGFKPEQALQMAGSRVFRKISTELPDSFRNALNEKR